VGTESFGTQRKDSRDQKPFTQGKQIRLDLVENYGSRIFSKGEGLNAVLRTVGGGEKEWENL